MNRVSRFATWPVMIAVMCMSGCDGVRPSTFTSGWSSSPEGSQNAASEEPEVIDEPVAESAEAKLVVFDDWRVHHDAPCPPEMVLVRRSFCIDRWEASLVEITAAGVRPFPPNQRVERRAVRAVALPDVMPQAYISGAEAQRGCEMAGKRLCTDQEWFDACEGPKSTLYPYGTVYRKDACNGDRPLHPMSELYGSEAGPEIWMVEPMNNPAINEQPDTLARTGSQKGCVGALGVYDLVGNLHEWTSDIAGTFRGGAYSTKNLLGCQYATTVHGFGYHDYSTGFRCCSEPNDL